MSEPTEAGRELDERIAVEVMRHCVFDPPQYRTEPWEVTPDNLRGRALKPYSTDIADAWLVVEAMRARGYRFRLKDDCGGVEKFNATFDGRDGFGYEEGYPAAYSICSAALIAVGAIAPDSAVPGGPTVREEEQP